MFTGIVEAIGQVKEVAENGTNKTFWIESPLSPSFKIDQSVSHDGVCLTVVAIEGSAYTVTAIQETLDKTNLKSWKTGDIVNLERAMKLGDRLDGHIVQGHVDQTGVCKSVADADGSHYFTFGYDRAANNLTIEKGSITVNGVSLTVVNSKENEFSVAIIPYTFEHTNFKNINAGTIVNLEFDVIGKYVARLQQLRN